MTFEVWTTHEKRERISTGHKTIFGAQSSLRGHAFNERKRGIDRPSYEIANEAGRVVVIGSFSQNKATWRHCI